MKIEDFKWAIQRVIWVVQKLIPTKTRAYLPPSYTSSILRFLRSSACMRAAPGEIECAKWSQTDALPLDPAIGPNPIGMKKPEGPFLLTAEYVCGGCKHPCVTSEEFIGKLWAGENSRDISGRTLQRYINSEQKMPVDEFKRAVANGFVERWLGKTQYLSIVLQIKELDATSKSLRNVVLRATERKAYRQHRELNVSDEDFLKEMNRQLGLLDHEATRIIDKRLKFGNLTPKERKILTEALFPGNDAT